MRRYRVTVDGRAFEVTVEEMSGGTLGAEPAARAVGDSSPPRVPAATIVERPVERKSAPGPEGAVTAPLPGLVTAIKVGPGDAVQAGQVLLILEAMKMENEITAPCTGTVADVHVQAGSSVGAGDPLVTIA